MEKGDNAAKEVFSIKDNMIRKLCRISGAFCNNNPKVLQSRVRAIEVKRQFPIPSKSARGMVVFVVVGKTSGNDGRDEHGEDTCCLTMSTSIRISSNRRIACKQ